MTTKTTSTPPSSAGYSVPYAVRHFWNAAYVTGTRITFSAGQFHFHAATPPLVRIQATGNRFGVFPEPTPVDPLPWILDGVEEHTGKLIAWLSVEWPKRLQRFAQHVLVCDHELKPLMRFAASIGEQIDGWCGQGGWIPAYHGPTTRNGEYRPVELPAILKDWEGIRFG